MDKEITLGSLFDGIGGFPLCAVLSGVTPVWAAEVEPGCIAVTKQHFPKMLHFGDVSKINGADLPPVDIITFGSPCQDLSIAGKRKGLKHIENGDDETTRSGLFMEAIRIIYEMRAATNGKYPTFIVWENVPGAYSSHNGNDFRTVLEEITKTDIPMPDSRRWANAGVVRGGGVCAAWRTLDAQYWSVPQRRKRIYLVGSFGSNCAEKILFKRDSVSRHFTPSWKKRKRVADVTQAGFGAADRSNVIYSAGFLDRNSADAFGIGYENEKSPCLRRGMIPSAVCVQENCIDRVGTEIFSAGFNGQNSISAANVELRETLSPTLTCSKQTDVIYMIPEGFSQAAYDKFLQDEKSATLKANGGTYGGGSETLVVNALNIGANSLIASQDLLEVAYQLNPTAFGVCSKLSNAMLSDNPHSGFYEANTSRTLDRNGANPCSNQGGIVIVGLDYISKIKNLVQWIVRRLIPLECERLQGFPDHWTELKKIDDMTDEDYAFWKNVYMTYKEINGKTVKNPPSKDFLVKWYNKLDSDATRYKQLGNSLAIPCALRVIEAIAEYCRKETNK